MSKDDYIDWSMYSKDELREAYRQVMDARKGKVNFIVASSDPKLLPQITQETIFEICERIAEGESMSAICTGDCGMPKLSHLLANAVESPVYGKLLDQAMRMRALKYGDDVVSDAEEGLTADALPQNVASRRLLIDAKKWYASKLMPRLFGEKLEVDSKTTVNVVIRRFEAGEQEPTDA